MKASGWLSVLWSIHAGRKEAIAPRRTMGRFIGVELNEKAVRNQLKNHNCKLFYFIISVGVAIIVSKTCLISCIPSQLLSH